MAGNKPTVRQTQRSRKYASAGGNPAYVTGGNVSHQQVPKKKQVPKSHPVTNDRLTDSFSRSTEKRSGMSANQAVNDHSKPGKARISSIADRVASAALFQEGIHRLRPDIFTGLV
jgi:hypothetical protein